MANKVGRPAGSGCKYDVDKLADELHSFIDSEPDPRLTLFCRPRNRPRADYLSYLAKTSDDAGNSNLSQAITRAKEAQQDYMCSNDCDIHPKIAGIRLATNHNMVERQQIDNNITGGLTIKVTLEE